MKEKNIEWNQINLFNSDNDIDELDDEEETYFDKENADLSGKAGSFRINKLVQTPLGLFSLDNAYHPLRGLPVYVAHINFPIVHQTILDLDKVNGIEAFKILGRYRILFVFGKLFNVEEVKYNIEHTLGVRSHIHSSVNLDDLSESLKEVIYEIDSSIESDDWVAYIFPNGKYILKNLATPEEASAVYDDFKQLYDISEGMLMSSLEPEPEQLQ